MQTFAIHTLGCKVNQYESEEIARILTELGLRMAEPAEADLRIINTCSVTSAADRKSRQQIRRAVSLPLLSETTAETNASARVIAVGCHATAHPDAVRNMPGVDAVITHHEDMRQRLPEVVRPWLKQRRIELPLADESIAAQRTQPRQRAALKIQDGCDAHCTYCIIPSLRPKLSSVGIEDAVADARRLVAEGHRELVLTGIFLGAYGQETALRRRQPGNAGEPLGDLVEALAAQVDGLLRIRLSSLEPGDLTPRLAERLRNIPQVTPHFHLPLQSGSDRVLRKMNRQYSRGDYLEMVDQVKQLWRDPAITTDILVGFPDEDDAAFAETLDVVEQVRFLHIHAFGYSQRPGTAAARWRQLPGDVIRRRVDTLIARSTELSREYRERFVGRTLDVIVERHPDEALLRGRTRYYFDVTFDGDASLIGGHVHVTVNEATANATFGQLAELAVGSTS